MKINKDKIRAFTQILLSIILIISIIQIIPDEVKIIEKASASSTIYQTNWSAPNDYVSINNLEFINGKDDIELSFLGQGIIVADQENNRIVITNMNGSVWIPYGTQGSGKGQFIKPGGLYYDNYTGYIYVADPNNHRIVKTKIDGSGWTTYGTSGSGKGQFNGPGAINYDSSTGYIYVVDIYNHRIVKTMMNGSGWTTYGTNGSGIGQFSFPSGIWYDNTTGDIYIADRWNYRIVKTKIDGTGWITYGTMGNGTGQFKVPSTIYYDSSTGYVYIADLYNSRIVKTKMDGTGWTSYGSFGTGKGQFSEPCGVCYDSNKDFVYVADYLNNRIVKTKMNGSGWTTFGSYGTSGKGKFFYPTQVTLCQGKYCPFGFLESKKYYLNGTADILSLSWTADTPPNTEVKFQLRSSNTEAGLSSKSFVGPNGSSTNYYNISDTNIWGGHYGDKWLQYKVFLSTSNNSITPVLKDVKIVYNLLPKRPIIISPLDNAMTNDNTTSFLWLHNDIDSASQMGYQWQVDNNKNFNSINFNITELNSSQNIYKPTIPIPDGIWYWRLRTQDSDGGWGPYSKARKILIDTKPPKSKITFPKNNRFYKCINIITSRTSDPDISSGINGTEIAINRLDDDKYWDGSAWNKGVTWLIASGTKLCEYNSSAVSWISGSQYNVRSRAWDNVGNYEIANSSVLFNIDTENPISNVDNPMDNSFLNRLNSISGSSIDLGGAGINKTEISIKRLSDDNYWDGTAWSANQTWLLTIGFETWQFNTNSIYWTSGLKYRIQTRSTDNVTNLENPGVGIIFNCYIDKPVSIVEVPLNNSCLNKLDTITGSSYDVGGLGVNKVEITIKNMIIGKYWNGKGKNWDTSKTWLNTKGNTTWSYNSRNVLWKTGNKYMITSRAIINIDVIEIPAGGVSFVFDTDNPESHVIYPGENNYLNNVKTIFGNASDIGGSSLESVDILVKLESDDRYWSESSSSWVTDIHWLQADGAEEWTLNSSKVDWISGEYYTICSRATDKAKNIELKLSEITFMFDNTPPGQKFTINDDSIFTNNRTVELSLDYMDSDSGVSEMSFRYDNEEWTSWELIQFSKSVNLTSGDGTKYLYFRVKDRAGNIGEPTSKSIILDTSPPDGSGSINNGDMLTNDIRVILSLLGIEDLSNITGVSFSSDMKLWSDWGPFIKQKNFTLSRGDGEKTVYCRLRDGAGNIGIFSDTIILDTTPPHSLSIIINDGSSETKLTKVTLKLHAVDDLSGVDQMSFCTQGEQWSSWEEFKDTISYELIPGNGQKIILFRVSDKAGNIAIPVHGEINLNMATPTQEKSQEELASNFYFWLILLVIIVIILVLLVIIILRRRRKTKQESGAEQVVAQEAIATKPIEALGSIQTPDKLTLVSQPPQLPPTTTMEIPGTSQELPTPQSAVPQNLPQVQPIPQLPPAAQQLQPTAASTPTTTPAKVQIQAPGVILEQPLYHQEKPPKH